MKNGVLPPIVPIESIENINKFGGYQPVDTTNGRIPNPPTTGTNINKPVYKMIVGKKKIMAMLSYEIDECQDIEILRQQCKKDWYTLALISETLVDYSKCHITAEKALKEIRKYMVQGEVEGE